MAAASGKWVLAPDRAPSNEEAGVEEKTMRVPLGCLAMLALLSGCQKAVDNGEANASGSAASNAAAPVPATQSAAKAVSVDTKNDVLEFGYGWPKEAAAIPELDRWLRGNMEAQRARAMKIAQESADEAKADGEEFNAYNFGEVWKVTADTPALLVLQGEGYEYTGGAHGNPFVATLIWDKAKKQRLSTKALFDLGVLSRAAKPRFCKDLDAQRAEKRGGSGDTDDGDGPPEFVQCVPLENQEIVPVSRNGKAIDLLRVEIMPYGAGPYSEGTYTIDLPMDAGLMQAVKPAWKAAFAPK